MFITTVRVIFLIGLGVYLRNVLGCGPLIGENKCVTDAECHVETPDDRCMELNSSSRTLSATCR